MSARILARLGVAIAAAGLVAISALRLEALDDGLRITRHHVGSIPVTAFAPSADDAPRSVVVIAHGFAGSQQLMLPFALTLAHRGYLVLTFDFPGHGRNPVPMAGGMADFGASTRTLLEALGEVAVAARRWPGSDGRLALLGHSMASDIVIRRAMTDDAVRATVALSAYSPVVTATSPRNLLIVDGELEPRMLHEEGLRIAGLGLGGAPAIAGRTYGDFVAGTARRFALADGVEHISVLYSRDAQLEALEWIDRGLGAPARGAGAPLLDSRGGWLALLYLGLVGLAWPLAALLPRATSRAAVAGSHAAVGDDADAPRRAAAAAHPAAAATATPAAMHRPARPPAADPRDEPLELPSISALDDVAVAAASRVAATPAAAVAASRGGPVQRPSASPPLRPSVAALGGNPWRDHDGAVAATAASSASAGLPGWRAFWPVAVLPALATPLLLWRLPGGFLPILLADYLMLHFATYGLLTALGLWLVRARRSPLAGVRPLALGFAALAATLYAVFVIGLPLDRYVTSFAPAGPRGGLLLAVFCGALPYFLADEWLVHGATRARGAYAFSKLMFLVSIALAIALNPERLFFLAIVVPAIVLAFVIYGLFSRWVAHSIGHPWAGAFANAVAFAWLIAVTFPVVSP